MLLINPLHDWVQIEPIQAEATKSGFILAAVKAKPVQAKALAIGPGKRTARGELIPTGITVGQTLLYTEGAMLEQLYRVDGEDVKLYFIQAEHVIGAI